MNITDFNPTGKTKLGKMNKLLSEQFGIKLNGAPERNKLERVMETANKALIQIRGSQKKFHLDPEYIKFLGLRDAAETMIAEGNYVKSPAYEAMANSLRTTVQELMDAGYSKDDACAETMNRARMNGAWAFAEDVMSPIIASAATQYVAEYEVANDPALVEYDAAANMSDALIAEMAKELNMKVEDTETLGAIAEKISMFAKVAGKTPEAIVEFLNGLNEGDMVSGIQMFGRKVAEGNRFSGEIEKARKAGKKEVEIDGKTYPVEPVKESQKLGEDAYDDMSQEINAHAEKFAIKGKDLEKYVGRTVTVWMEGSSNDPYQSRLQIEAGNNGQGVTIQGEYYGPEDFVDHNSAADYSWKSQQAAEHYADLQSRRDELDETFLVREAQEAAMKGDVSMFNDIIDSILNEEVDVEQAEVVMAVRSLADDVQSQIERISDMMNKDVPAIADQMRAEQGATAAQQFSDTISGNLNAYLEAARTCKAGIDSQVLSLSGEAPADVGGLGDTGMAGMDAPADDGDLGLDAPVDTNEPAAAGPEDEPLGRAEV